MLCPNCGNECERSHRFCLNCGHALGFVCTNCGASLNADANFCVECGTPVDGADARVPGSGGQSHPSTPTPQQDSTEGDRRHITVMFCDLVGSTLLSERLDPEELREVIRAYQKVCGEAIERYEGHVAKYLGDGLMAYFGYPEAHEDDAVRAGHAGLALLADMAHLNTRLEAERGFTLSVRIGVHTGLVVAGEMGSGHTRERLAVVGETPNIASRLEGVAEPNSLVVSSITQGLIEGHFVCESMGAYPLRGVTLPVEVYRVLRATGLHGRLEVATTASQTPLVGRESEITLLLERWEHVKEGSGQVVLLGGEAGIGKSRLVQAMRERLVDVPHAIWEGRCSAYFQNSAFHAVVDYLERRLQFSAEDSSQEKLSKLEATLGPHSMPQSEIVPLLCELLSVPVDDRYPPLGLTPQRQRERTLEVLLEMLVESASHQRFC